MHSSSTAKTPLPAPTARRGAILGACYETVNVVVQERGCCAPEEFRSQFDSGLDRGSDLERAEKPTVWVISRRSF